MDFSAIPRLNDFINSLPENVRVCSEHGEAVVISESVFESWRWSAFRQGCVSGLLLCSPEQSPHGYLYAEPSLIALWGTISNFFYRKKDAVHLFNNCHNRQHDAMYGKGAFYDLNTTGFQATLANNVPVGETCIVASLDAVGDVTFDWYRFMRETVKADNTGVP